MSILYLHIGGPKTGSTFIQSVFRMNRILLRSHDIHYPHGLEPQNIDPASWTSGNGDGILEAPEAFEKALREVKDQSCSSMLFSHEGLRNDVCRKDTITFMREIASAYGFQKIKILFFVRNPVDYAVSIWQQQVKDSGMTDTLEDRIRHPQFMINNVEKSQQILENLSGHSFFDLTALNYSRCATRLLDIISDWLDINIQDMSIPEVTRINRSLTKGELALQLAMNKILGGDARILAKALTENLTNIRNEKIIPSAEGQQILRDRLEPYIRQANLHLPKGHEIIFDQQEPAPHISGEYLFSEAQLEVIGTILAEEIRNLRYPCHPPSTVPPSILRQLWGKMKCRIFP